MDPINTNEVEKYQFDVDLLKQLPNDLVLETIKYLPYAKDTHNLALLNHFWNARIVIILSHKEYVDKNRFTSYLNGKFPGLTPLNESTRPKIAHLDDLQVLHARNEAAFGIQLLKLPQNTFDSVRKDALIQCPRFEHNNAFHITGIFSIFNAVESKEIKTKLLEFYRNNKQPDLEIIQPKDLYDRFLATTAKCIYLLKIHKLDEAIACFRVLSKEYFFNSNGNLMVAIVQKIIKDSIPTSHVIEMYEIIELLSAWNRVLAYVTAAEEFFKIGIVDEAFNMIAKIPDTHDAKSTFLQKAYLELFEQDKKETVFQSACQVTHIITRSLILKSMSDSLIKNCGDLILAEKIIEAIPDINIQLEALKTLFAYLVSIKEHVRARAIAYDARTDSLKCECFRIIAKELTKIDAHVIAQDIAFSISDDKIKHKTLFEIILLLIKKANRKETVSLIKSLPDASLKYHSVIELFEQLDTEDEQRLTINQAGELLNSKYSNMFFEFAYDRLKRIKKTALANLAASFITDPKIRKRLSPVYS